MDTYLKFSRGLVDLFESHADERWLPKTDDWKNSEAACIAKILKKGAHSARRQRSGKCEIQVFCSVIHLSSSIVFLLAQQDLRAQQSLNIEFFQTSSQALRGFKKATDQKCPALVTVTEGTASILSQTAERFWQFMQVPPAALKWASSERIVDVRKTDLSRLQYVVANHPTDLGVFEEFNRKHLLTGEKPAEVLLIDESPESIEVLAKAERDQLLLVNPHMAAWAQASVNNLKPLHLLRGWQVVEQRYIFCNKFFWDSLSGDELRDLYFYLKDKFENLRREKSDFVTNTRIGKEAFLKIVMTDYFNF